VNVLKNSFDGSEGDQGEVQGRQTSGPKAPAGSAAAEQPGWEEVVIMRKAMIVKVFVGSVIGFGAALVLFLVAGGLALANDSFVMDGSDVVGIRSGAFGWAMIAIAATAVVVMAAAAAAQFVAWIGAVLNTAQLADKAWFIVLLVAGLVSLGFVATLAYVLAGPDGEKPHPAPAAWTPPSVPADGQDQPELAGRGISGPSVRAPFAD
jgi:hypothetical protein